MNSPNILWICTDQQRWDTIGALGNPHVQTPCLDQLCAEGVAFRHAYCQSPICTPSRSSFLTGFYPSTVHGCRNDNDNWSEGAELIPKTLRDQAGYDCGLVGKLHLAGAYQRVLSGTREGGDRVFARERRPRDDGYRVFHWSHSPYDDWGDQHAYRVWLADKGVSLAALQAAPDPIPAACHQTTFCADKAIAFMREPHAGPWLMSVNPFDPHTPFDPPRDYRARFDAASLPAPVFHDHDVQAQAALAALDFQTAVQRPDPVLAREQRAAYYAMIALIDANVGRMLQVLEETGQRENTVVIFMSDHGEMLGDHGLWRKGCRFYEGLVRVPLILSWPGRFHANAVSHALVELVDLVPTLRELAGLSLPAHMPGRSLVSLLTGETDLHAHRAYVRAEFYGSWQSRPNAGRRGSYGTMIRTRQHKLVNYHGHQLGELFDLQQDPHEFHNLWHDADYADVRWRLMQMSFDALACAVDPGTRQRFPY